MKKKNNWTGERTLTTYLLHNTEGEKEKGAGNWKFSQLPLLLFKRRNRERIQEWN